VRAADWLWANPVLRREWSTFRRRIGWRGVLWSWLSLTLPLATTAVAAHWLSRGERSPWEARGFLLVACLLYLVWLSIAVPGPAAGRLTGERERRTWTDLLLTALRPSQIVSAKLVASLWSPVVALGQFLPLLGMSAHAARLPAARLTLILAVLVASSVLVTAVALWLSGRCRHTLTAATLAYLLTGSWIWGTLAVSPEHFVRGENLWWYCTPAWQVALLSLVEPGPSPLARPLLPEWAWFLLGCAAVSSLSLVLLTRRVARSGE
jgi:hypothetical protein